MTNRIVTFRNFTGYIDMAVSNPWTSLSDFIVTIIPTTDINMINPPYTIDLNGEVLKASNPEIIDNTSSLDKYGRILYLR